MDIIIRGIKGRGDKTHERIILTAAKDLDIGSHMLIAARTAADGKTLGGRIPFGFWFPDTQAQSEDLLVVYTKAGRSISKENSSGGQSHFFYWGLPESIWDDPQLRPVLLEVSMWKAWANRAAVLEDQTPS